MSRLAAKLATVEGVKPAHVAVVLSIAAQSGKDGGAVISAARLAQRCGMSKGHAWRSIQWAYHANLLQIENVDGRSNRYVFETTCSAGATGVARAPATGVTRRRDTFPVLIQLLILPLRQLGPLKGRSRKRGRRPKRGRGCLSVNGSTPRE